MADAWSRPDQPTSVKFSPLTIVILVRGTPVIHRISLQHEANCDKVHIGGEMLVPGSAGIRRRTACSRSVGACEQPCTVTSTGRMRATRSGSAMA